MDKFPSEQAFKDQFLKGTLPPLVLWVGEEDYSKSEVLAFLRREAPKQGFYLEVYSAEEDAPSEVLGRAATPSLLGGKTLLVLTEVERCGSSEQNFLKRYATSPLSDLTLITVVSSGVDIDDDFIQSLAQRAAVLEFPFLTGKDLAAWATGKAKTFGLEFEEKALASLAAAFAGQLARLASEIEKLSLLYPQGGVVSAREIEGALGASIWEITRELTDAISEGRLKDALQAWKEQRLLGEKPEETLSDLFKMASKLPKFEEDLETLYSADLSIKTGVAPEAVLMPLVIARIAHPALKIKEERPIWLK